MEASGELSRNRLRERPIAGSILIGALAALLLQASNIIDFQDLVASAVVDDFVTVRLIDIGFRMTMGAVLVLVATPLVLGYLRKDGWHDDYPRLVRITMGPSPRNTVMATVLSALVFVAVLVVFAIAAGVFRGDPAVLISDDNWLILLAALVPGVWEELAFRGVILANLRRRYSPIAAVAVSSVVFGLFHFSNLLNWDDSSSVVAGVIAATMLGFAWGYLVIKTHSIVPAIVLHYLVDVILFDELFIDPLASDESTSTVYVAIIFLYPLLTVFVTNLVVSRPASGTG